MSLQFNIPHTAKFDSPSIVFTAALNVGQYDFSGSANTFKLFPLERNSVYLIERMAIGGNISNEIYFNSILTTPLLTFTKSITQENVYKRSIPIVNYYPDRQATTFVHSDKAGDSLLVNLSGVLDQIAETVGKNSISIFLTLSVYEIALKDYSIYFRSADTQKY